MSYCVKCGAKVDDGIMICPQCGAQIPILSGSYFEGKKDADNGDSGSFAGQQYTYGQESLKSYGQESRQGGYQYSGDLQNGCHQSTDGQTGYRQSSDQAQYYGTGDYFDQDEVRRNKGMGVLSYLGILVIIPLLAGDKRSEYVKQHVNQGLVLFILSSLVDLVEGEWAWSLFSFIHFGGGLFSWMFDILGLVFLVLMVMGIVTAYKGERRELPLIGKIKFFR